MEQMIAAANWNGVQGAALYRQHTYEKNHDKREAMLRQAQRHFTNYDTLTRTVWLMQHTKKRH